MRAPSPPLFRPLVTFLARTATMCLLVGNVIAAELDLDQIIDDRQRNLRDMGAAFKAITDELKRSKPSLITAGQDIDVVRHQQEQLGKVCAGCHKTLRAKDD